MFVPCPSQPLLGPTWGLTSLVCPGHAVPWPQDYLLFWIPLGSSWCYWRPVLCSLAAPSAVDTLGQDTSGWMKCLYVLGHHLAQRGQHVLAMTLAGLVASQPWL